MTTKLASILLTIAATTSVASADIDQPTATPAAKARPASVVTVGIARVLEDTHDRMALTLEGSHRIGDSRSHVHAQLSFSNRDSDLDGARTGRFDQLRVGVEGKTRGQLVRGFIGADFGLAYEHTTLYSVRPDIGPMHRLDSSLLTVPRAGIEVGERFLARACIEAVLMEHDNGRDVGLGMSLAAGTAF